MQDLIASLKTAVTRDEARSLILRFQGAVAQLPNAMFDDCLPLKHIFTPGVYIREIFLPKDSLVIGKIHKEEHYNFISSGHVLVFTEYGGREEFKGPLSLVSKPGTKRVVLALEDTVWTTIHHNPTNETDLKKLEDMLIARTFPEYDRIEQQRLIRSMV